MSKFIKFIRNPALFFHDAANKLHLTPHVGTVTYVVGFSTWKQYMRKFFSDRDLIFLPREISEHEFNLVWQKKILSNRNAEMFIWGFKAPAYILKFIKKNKIKVVFVEDGFVRSVQLGATKAPPMSLCLDTRTPYFNSREPSDLEIMLGEYDFAAKSDLLARAENAIRLLLETGVSKYNNAPSLDVNLIYGPKAGKRILVIGQVEDDASIEFGCDRVITNNDMVRMAAKEHPAARIIYKPHPDVLEGHRPAQSNPADVANICLILKEKLSIGEALETIDHVYSITSLAGFEALLRGISVTVLGAPFYAGWGLTDDRQLVPRRNRQLTLTQLFAVAYLLYPKYFDPDNGKRLELEDVIGKIYQDRKGLALFDDNVRGEKSQTENKSETKIETESIETKPKSMTTYVVGEVSYKALLGNWFGDRKFFFIPTSTTSEEFIAKFKKGLDSNKHAEFFITGECPIHLKKFIETSHKKIIYLSDGFIRSIELDPKRTPPCSLLLDGRAPHYDARKATDLEELLNHHDFEADAALSQRADTVLGQLMQTGLSKFNHVGRVPDLEAIYGPKTRLRVLVLGQVEDAASVKLANPKTYSNNDVVTIASMENPDAQIIFKPHPDVINKLKKTASNPARVRHLCQVLEQDLPLAQALETIDHVYSISSLGGFEALLRGIETTTLGLPFYAGWGLGDDRQPIGRRQRRLDVKQVFAAAYLLYPVYVDSLYKTQISAEEVIKLLSCASRLVPNWSTAMLREIDTKQRVDRGSLLVKTEDSVIPDWFQSYMGIELARKIDNRKPLFLYIPWISEHGDTLMRRIDGNTEYELAALDLIKSIEDNKVRKSVSRFVRLYPDTYRKMVSRRLVPLRNKIKGVILTFDWAPVMRIIADVCKDLNISIILIPHESVFVDREKYYWDLTSKASIPVADVVLGWGNLQKEIFLERGYPAERFIAVGAPKFDMYHAYRPQLNRTQFCRLFNLNENKKIILFASQPLDSQVNQKAARDCQRNAIADLLSYSKEMDCQLIIRLPPSKDDVIGNALKIELISSSLAKIDDSLCYLVSPEEALFHSDAVISINSTMLFEGLLQGRPALSLRYMEFNQIWENVGIPSAKSLDEFRPILNAMLDGLWSPPSEGMSWAANMLGVGEFDGHAADRIRSHLISWSLNSDGKSITELPTALERLFSKSYLDVVAIPSNQVTLNSIQKHLPYLLNARTVQSSRNIDNMSSLASVEIFFQWGITQSSTKTQQADIASALGRPIVIVEDGFIRSIEIGLSGEPGLAIILDDSTAYYDATKISRLERLLQGDLKLDAEQIIRAKTAMNKIVCARVSKYNHAPDAPIQVGIEGRKKVLLVDQRFGDQSVKSGLADESTFDRMLYDVIRERPDCDIIIKQHPDAIKGGKTSYFSYERIAKFMHLTKNIYTINFDVNPFALFDVVDEVYVGTSGMGFEALMAGKHVHCYGVPFYAGWGVTEDKIKLQRRNNSRTVEELFHFSYIESSRYFHPERHEVVEVEDLVDYIVDRRGW